MKKIIIFFLVVIIYSSFIHTNLPEENNSEKKKLEKKVMSHHFCPCRKTIQNPDTNESLIICESGSNCIVKIIDEAITMNQEKKYPTKKKSKILILFSCGKTNTLF
jgi:hypothetical protein